VTKVGRGQGKGLVSDEGRWMEVDCFSAKWVSIRAEFCILCWEHCIVVKFWWFGRASLKACSSAWSLAANYTFALEPLKARLVWIIYKI
jgi:hypothetical protein